MNIATETIILHGEQRWLGQEAQAELNRLSHHAVLSSYGWPDLSMRIREVMTYSLANACSAVPDGSDL